MNRVCELLSQLESADSTIPLCGDLLVLKIEDSEGIQEFETQIEHADHRGLWLEFDKLIEWLANEKDVWDEPPTGDVELTAYWKRRAKERARKASRPYPNKIDNMWAAQQQGKSESVEEAEYRGREVKLNKPTRGDVKKYKVYVKNPKTGNVIKVNFGDPGMEIKRDDPEKRKSFRARHKCHTAKDKTKARYWSCKFWSRTPISKLLKK